MATLPVDYEDHTTPTGAKIELPATTTRGLNAITTQINSNTTALAAKGTYSKPGGGIPASDMTAAVQASLAKTDLAPINTENYGAVGDGTTDNTTAIQAAIDAAADAVTAAKPDVSDVFVECAVLLPSGIVRSDSLTLPEGVQLHGQGTTLRAVTGFTGDLVTIDGPQAGIRSLHIRGNGAAGETHGVVFTTNAVRAKLVDCHITGWYTEACLVNGGVCWIERCYMEGFRGGDTACDALEAMSGVLHITGADNWVTDCELNGRRWHNNVEWRYGLSSNGYAAAFYEESGGYNTILRTICEQADHGVVASGFWSNYIGVRGELCPGHGFWIKGTNYSTHTLAFNCVATSNSAETDNAYDQFHVDAETIFIGTNLATDNSFGVANSYPGLPRASFYISSPYAQLVNCRGSNEDHVVYADGTVTSPYVPQFVDGGAGGHINLAQIVPAPATVTSAGIVGQIAHDNDYIYICIGTDWWKRAAITGWE